jgi:hypothetical protein
MEMVVGLLLWNTSNFTHVAEHLKLYAEMGETDFFPQANVSEGLVTALCYRHLWTMNYLPV